MASSTTALLRGGGGWGLHGFPENEPANKEGPARADPQSGTGSGNEKEGARCW